jgi:hypothetical protein
MKHAFALALCVLAALAGCAPAVSETRMTQEPPREAACKLDLISADITSPAFMQKWELVGYVTVRDQTDPNAPAAHDEARPHACAMGGTAIALAMMAGQSGVVYMVLHPKQPANGSVTF